MIRRWLLGTAGIAALGLTTLGLWRLAPGGRADALRDLVVPRGTLLVLGLDAPLASDTTSREDEVRAQVLSPVVVGGETAIPAGSPVVGQVVDVARSGRVSGRAHIAMLFHTLTVEGTEYRIHTSVVARSAPGTGNQDALRVGVATGFGALVGGVIGHGKGAAIGGDAQAGHVLSTRGPEVRLRAGAAVTARLNAPLVLHLRNPE